MFILLPNLKSRKLQLICLEIQDPIYSLQVIQELSNILNKKFQLNWGQILLAIEELVENYSIVTNNFQIVKSACKLANKYQFSFYDSLIISAALEANCNILYTEDLQHNQLIENKLRIVNPFK
jgi:predicted nucleic acid-binding protein